MIKSIEELKTFVNYICPDDNKDKKLYLQRCDTSYSPQIGGSIEIDLNLSFVGTEFDWQDFSVFLESQQKKEKEPKNIEEKQIAIDETESNGIIKNKDRFELLDFS